MDWKIDNVWSDAYSGKVSRMDVIVSSVEGEYSASEPRSIWMHDVDTDYEGLTEEKALEAAKNALGEHETKMLAYNLDTKINEMKNPQFVIGLPWKQS